MISIIVACWVRPDLTQVCIDSILNYTKDFELIMVQEGEDEELTALLNDYKDKGLIVFLQNKTPKGYAGALNTGMAFAKGDYLCFMNNDTVATPRWMDEMMEAFKEKEVGLVSPTFWGMGSRQSVDWNMGQQFDYVLEPLDLVGVCYLIPKKVMERVGKWDEDFFHGGEDFDLTIRIQNAGYSMVIARKSFIYHYGGASTRILLGNDLEKVKKHHYEKLNQLIAKHNLNPDDVFKKLRLK